MTVNVYLWSAMAFYAVEKKGVENGKYIWQRGSFGAFVCTLSEFLAGLVSKSSSSSQIPNS